MPQSVITTARVEAPAQSHEGSPRGQLQRSGSGVSRAGVAQRDDGKFWVSRLTLKPRVAFSGEKLPDNAAIQAMHDKAHQHCFIANSVLCDVVVEPQLS